MRDDIKFFSLTFALSIPLWIVALFVQDVNVLPMNLPPSALMAFCPVVAAIIVVHRKGGQKAVRALLARTLDWRRVAHKSWFLPIILLMPLIMAASYGAMLVLGLPLPEPSIDWMAIPLLFAVFLAPAISEELGWSGYATDSLQKKHTALKTGLFLGGFTAVWHIVPLLQTSHSLWWIAGQCVVIFMLRILTVWLYNNTGRSVFAAVLFHTVGNICFTLFPNNSSHYDAVVTSVITSVVVVLVVAFWGETLVRRPVKRRVTAG